MGLQIILTGLLFSGKQTKPLQEPYISDGNDDNTPVNTIERKLLTGNILGTSNGLIKNLNVDITAKVLSHIPIECVSLGRAVCKLWRILLKKPKTGFLLAVSEIGRHSEEIQIFYVYNEEVSIHDEPISHKTLAKIDLGLGLSRDIPVQLIKNGPFNPVIYGSCNGLVCFPVQNDETKSLFYICNPMTGEYVYLPEMDFGEISRPEVLGGFGYCQSTNEYKVVQVTYEYNQFEQLGRVQVYTLGSGSGWRNKGEIHYTSKERLVFANEALYWLEHIEDDWNLRTFHLADETFGTVPMPPCHDVVRGYRELVSLNGCLCAYHVTVERCSEQEDDAYYRKEDKRMDMWILKKVQKNKKNGVEQGDVVIVGSGDDDLLLLLKDEDGHKDVTVKKNRYRSITEASVTVLSEELQKAVKEFEEA
ncbi:F-box protein At3g07870-like [Papaver somniferum]|uniref:F-box protein At3g07870-like n=1 Tax=Papaver somniferum TaxID=3469 RepID=UPI000E6FC1A4|nr:F-box protein At3g07870-like [Papaver somniferum]